MSEGSSSSSGGVGFTGLLTVLFIGLKLTGHIDWSWWWVLSPIWIGFALFVGVLAVLAAGAGVVVLIERRRDRKRLGRRRV